MHTSCSIPDGRIKLGVYTRGLKRFNAWHTREAHNILSEVAHSASRYAVELFLRLKLISSRAFFFQ